MSKININPFEGITNIDFDECAKENPLKDFTVPKGMFRKEESHFMFFDDWDTGHWETLLNNRLLSVGHNFAYAMFYYYRGIPDDEWYISPGKEGKSIEYYPHFDEIHYSNFYNFTYFVDVFFLKAYTLFETIGHLLYKVYDIKQKPRDLITFKNAIANLKNINKELYKELTTLKHSNNFKDGAKMRNDIAHNHPPHHKSSGVKKINGVELFGIGEYTTSSEIKLVMIGFLESIMITFDILQKYLPSK